MTHQELHPAITTCKFPQVYHQLHFISVCHHGNPNPRLPPHRAIHPLLQLDRTRRSSTGILPDSSHSQFVKLSETKAYSPTGLVPVLQCHSLPSATITDSLAICEFLAESNPTLPLWPTDRHLRALARSAAAQMHSGFPVLRNTFHSNYLARYTGNVPIPVGAAAEIARMFRIWDSARKATTERLAALGAVDEGFLFGGFSIADAFFWPVLWRFRSYGLPLEGAGPGALAWMAKMWSDPVFKALGDSYYAQAEDPHTRIAHYDDIFRDMDDVQYGLFPKDWTFSVSG